MPSITDFDHPNLVAAFTMDNVHSDMNFDESPNGNDVLDLFGTTQVDGIDGFARNFNGTNEYHNRIGGVPGASIFDHVHETLVFSHAYWFKMTDYDNGVANGFAGNTRSQNDRGFQFRFNGGGHSFTFVVRTAVFGESIVSSSTATVEDNGWHHVAVVGDGTAIGFYIDGVFDTSTVAQWPAPAGGAARPVDLGREPDSFDPGNYFEGTLDTVRFFNSELTPAEVLELYHEYDDGTPGTGQVNDLRYRALVAAGYSGNLDDMMFYLLADEGYTGSLNDKTWKALVDGFTYPWE